MLSLFNKDFYCAITLFTNMDVVRSAYVDVDHSPHFRVYAITAMKTTFVPLGWIHACPFPLAAMACAEDMHNKRLTFGLFKNGWYRFEPGKTRLDPINSDDYEDLQLAAIYPVRARTEKAAAKLGWAKFLAGSSDCDFWYEPGTEGKWAALFGHTSRAFVSKDPPSSKEGLAELKKSLALQDTK
jgi:hypothetical protein